VKVLALAFVSALLSAAPAFGQPAAPSVTRLPSVTLPPELDRVLRDYERLWKARDGDGLSQIFTEDGFIAKPAGWIRGRAAIAEQYKATSGGELKLRALGYAASDTVGYIVGAYAYGETAATRDNGKFTLTLRRRPGGMWLIASDLDSAVRQ
jgi:hypothetical protein